jgi:hypothetical protein
MAKRKKSNVQYLAFIQEVGELMKKHGVTDMVVFCDFDKQFRNTYIPLSGKENPLYCHVSDAMDAWLRQARFN